MKKNKNDLHSKAVALCEGQIVECSGHLVKAITIPPEHWSCYFCAACNMEMCDLCVECDGYSHQKHILRFAYQSEQISGSVEPLWNFHQHLNQLIHAHPHGDACKQTDNMNELLQHKYDVLASLYWIPCSLRELEERDFCSKWPRWYIVSIVITLETEGLLKEQKNGIYKAIKTKARRILNKLDYVIDD